MQIIITKEDFDIETGLPTGAFERLVNDWAEAICENKPSIVIGGRDPAKMQQTLFPGRDLKIEPPKAEPPKAEPPKAEPPKAEPPKAEPPKAEPQGLPNTNRGPKTSRKRRTKEEIEKSDDAACQLEIINAKREGREPNRENLPKDTRKRVGRNPKSWLSPQASAEIMSPPEDSPRDDKPPGDFSEFMTVDPTDPLSPEAESNMRFEIGNKMVQLGQLSRPDATSIISRWKNKYNTTTVTDLPADELAGEIARVEVALDKNKCDN